jgi:transcriptional regulator
MGIVVQYPVFWVLDDFSSLHFHLRGHTQMAKNDLQGSLDLLILKTLARMGDLHGYGIVLHIQRASDELLSVEEGSLYPALHRMEQSGWVTSQWGLTETRRKAKFYKLTAAGRKQLKEAEESFEQLVKGVRALLRFA